MSRRRKHNGHRNYARHQLTETQRLALIPAGPAYPGPRELAVEQVALDRNDRAMVTRQVVSTMLRKLKEAGDVTPAEYGAAVRFREDYECAFLTSRNPLQAVQVDGDAGGGDLHGAMLYRASSAIRFRDAEMALGPYISRILRLVVLEDGGDAERSFTAIGAELAPSSRERSHRDTGRGASIRAIQHLAWIYERGAQQKRRSRNRHNSGGNMPQAKQFDAESSTIVDFRCIR